MKVFAVLCAFIFLQFVFLLLLQKNKYEFYEQFGRKTTGTAGAGIPLILTTIHFKMELYHGSYTKVEQPHIIKGHYTKDFGIGFYCTRYNPHYPSRQWFWRKHYAPIANYTPFHLSSYPLYRYF